MTNYTLNQIARAINKIYNEGITSDKEIMQITYGKMAKLKTVSPIEKLIILDYSEALKLKQVTTFLSGRRLRKEVEKDGISKQNTTN